MLSKVVGSGVVGTAGAWCFEVAWGMQGAVGDRSRSGRKLQQAVVGEDKPRACKRKAREEEAMSIALHGKRGSQQLMHVGM